MKQILVMTLIALTLFSGRSFAQQDSFDQDVASPGQTTNPGSDPNGTTPQGADVAATGLCEKCIANTNQDILGAQTTASTGKPGQAGGTNSSQTGDH